MPRLHLTPLILVTLLGYYQIKAFANMHFVYSPPPIHPDGKHAWRATARSDVYWRFCNYYGNAGFWTGAKKNDCDNKNRPFSKYGGFYYAVWCANYCDLTITADFVDDNGNIIFSDRDSVKVLGGRLELLYFPAPTSDAQKMKVKAIRDNQSFKNIY